MFKVLGLGGAAAEFVASWMAFADKQQFGSSFGTALGVAAIVASLWGLSRALEPIVNRPLPNVLTLDASPRQHDMAFQRFEA